MSKLAPSLKALINAPFARPGAIPAPSHIRSVFEDLSKEASERNVGAPAWLSLATATTFTLNSPESLNELYKVASPVSDPVVAAELMREVGLKCIGFNGVPRTINMLNAFRASLPKETVQQLSTTPTRAPSPQNIESINTRGFGLWKSVYNPLDEKLYNKLADAHPDLPVFIVHGEYGALFADPSGEEVRAAELSRQRVQAKVGRVLTSVIAVACLRAQTGVGPQVLSHVFGLRKAYQDGTAAEEQEIKGGEWLAGDDGSTWLLEKIDALVKAIGGEEGSSFAPVKAKL